MSLSDSSVTLDKTPTTFRMYSGLVGSVLKVCLGIDMKPRLMCDETRALASLNYTSYSLCPQQPMESKMTRVDEINVQIAKLEAEREDAMLKERANVLAKMKADIKLYGFKTSEFKGVLATRKKRGTKANANPSAPKRAYTKKAK